jgi:cation diffusion facilitator family transporter
MTKQISDLRVVATSLTVSVSDVVLNLVVAVITGSTVMLSQSLQGLSDLITGGILLLGVKRSKKEADTEYQFGYGREIFFWVLMAGVLMFLGTGGLSLYFGIQQFINPHEITDVYLAVIMLVIGFSSNFYSLQLSVRRINQSKAKDSWWWQLRYSSIVETKATLLIDFLGTVAAALGMTAILVYILTGNARFDGLGSMAIGFMMMIAAILLIKDVRDLIVGRSVDVKLARKITRIAQKAQGVVSVLDLRTMYLGSGKLLVIIEIHVQDGFDTDEVEKIVDNVKHLVMQSIPEVHHIQVEIETPDSESVSIIT